MVRSTGGVLGIEAAPVANQIIANMIAPHIIREALNGDRATLFFLNHFFSWEMALGSSRSLCRPWKKKENSIPIQPKTIF